MSRAARARAFLINMILLVASGLCAGGAVACFVSGKAAIAGGLGVATLIFIVLLAWQPEP